MKIEINNVGVIDKASFECNGITIITGKNGSGKSTVAKSVASIYSALINSRGNMLADCKEYVRNKIVPAVEELLFLVRRRVFWSIEKNEIIEDNDKDVISPILLKIIYDRYPASSFEELISFLKEVLDHLTNSKDYYYSIFKKKKTSEYLNYRMQGDDFYKIYDSCIGEVSQTLQYIQQYKSENYLFESIKNQLNYSFHGQLAPIGDIKKEPVIGIFNDNVHIEYHHNDVNSSKIDFSSAINSYYISDGCVLDQIDSSKRRVKRNISQDGINPSFLTLTDALISALSSKKNIVLSNEIYHKYPDIIDLLDSVWPHSMMKQKGVTINSNSGLNIANEASGAKIFIIIKTLLLNGFINSNTTLFFDEPENHLHPEWQTTFAKLIINISKSIGTKIFCITHSQTMLLALDVYTKKFGYLNNTHIYFGEKVEGRSNFEDCTNNMQKAHRKLTDPYVFMGLDVDYDNE